MTNDTVSDLANTLVGGYVVGKVADKNPEAAAKVIKTITIVSGVIGGLVILLFIVVIVLVVAQSNKDSEHSDSAISGQQPRPKPDASDDAPVELD